MVLSRLRGFAVLLAIVSISHARDPSPNVPPLVFETSGQWHGNDGPWSAFTIRLGTPSQTVNLLPVPYRSALVVVAPEGCPNNPLLSSCPIARGNVFDPSASTTWSAIDQKNWEPTEVNLTSPARQARGRNSSEAPPPQPLLAVKAPNQYGVDAVRGGGRGRQFTVPDQGVINHASMDPFTGLLGLDTNFNSVANNPTSFFDNVRSISEIKSVSWSYTAGSVSQSAPGSLVFGGYDASRFDPKTTLSTSMKRENRTFTLWLGDIAFNGGIQSPQTLYEPRVIVDLDFTTPYLSLPNEICRMLERILSLKWDEQRRLYLVNETVHQDMVTQNASLNFQMFGDSGKQQFNLPYESLVLTATFPMVNATTKYFAVQRARSGSFFLGRAFLQSTYLTAVFDHPGGGYFNLSQAHWSKGAQPRIMAIKPADAKNQTAPSSEAKSESSGLSGGAIGGIVAGVVALLAGVAYLIWASKTKHFPFSGSNYSPTETSDPEKADLDAKKAFDDTAAKKTNVYEVEGDQIAAEVEGPPPPPVELPGDPPPELDGKIRNAPG